MELKITQKQEEIYNITSAVGIVALGKGEGATTGLFYKTLDPHYKDRTIVFLTKEPARAMREYYKLVDELGILCNIHYTWQTVTTINGTRVVFTSDDMVVREEQRDVLFIDGVIFFDKEDIRYYLSRAYRQVIITTTPYECGWRNPKYNHGQLLLNKDGNIDYEYSWDRDLIDWDKLNPMQTRCLPQHYKHFVTVVTGSGDLRKSNPFLDEGFIKEMEMLDPEDQYRLNGEWKEM